MKLRSILLATAATIVFFGLAPTVATAEEESLPLNAYFGDLHIHTGNSFDAFVFGTRRTPDDAYRFAKGEKIKHDGGYEIELEGPPLDFLAVTDHGEYLGVIPAMADPNHPLSQTETAKAAFGKDATDPQTTFQSIGVSFVLGQPIEDINDQAHMNSVWAQTVDAAKRHYEPGKFTTFAAYEFTAMRALDPDAEPGNAAAANLHRNVVFRDTAPDQLFTTLNSINPEDLWKWMETQRTEGIDALAIPHNSNASNGEMFAKETYSGEPITEDYVSLRMANEPLVEITQLKGTSDAHPILSPNDEWSDFERYENYIGAAVKATVNDGDFVRQSLARGLEIEEAVGANPYEYGFIGSSDTHIAAGTFVEKTHWGKFPVDGATAEARNSVPPKGAKTWEGAEAPIGRALAASQYSSSGLAGVWASENTREALFDAMRRRETFGTSGPRMKVRFFAGNDLNAADLESAELLNKAYANGVPMGGNVEGNGLGESGPNFLAWAVQDPLSAPLQRLQVIKVWAANGRLKEAVYDVACSGGDAVDPISHRCADNGASVDITTCETTAGTGAGELKAAWQDPEFDASQDAAYYVRVLENPTCRWSTWDAVRAGVEPNPDLPKTLQERAWSSPIWVSAKAE